ncbi:MAG: hypothetical protein C4542_08705 [Dehalococcoidia bacterium]|nr:MAG: hypothetical protein C4542_08705 [Dehalococcoidia bacterium]
MGLADFSDLRVGDRFLAEGEGDYIEEFTIVEISPDKKYVKVDYAEHANAEREYEWLEINNTEVLVKLAPKPPG